MKKGISPIIASVLLIAFTVAVAGIISGWLTSFTTSSTQTVKSQSDIELTCSYGGISLKSLIYSNNKMSGYIDNTRQISLGGITLQIIFNNKSIQNIKLCSIGGATAACDSANASISPRETTTFNVSTNSNYEKIRVYTNCSSVYDEAGSGDVSS